MLNILLVDDEPSILVPYAEALRDEGHQVVTAEDGSKALQLIGARAFDVIISDIRLPNASGLEIFKLAKARSPATQLILMTAYAKVEDAVEVLKAGALDYLTKPFALDPLLRRLERISQELTLSRELEAERAKPKSAGPVVGSSASMARLNDLLGKFADREDTVLITGESGTGKELVAHALHDKSRRRQGPFVAINCAAFPDTLLEAELFGHERGAFTGAVKKREGRFMAATGGTLFLDEVAEMSISAQAKLLRVLQEGTYQPLGTNTTQRANVRIIAATHRNLKERISERVFREDLYFRLKVLELAVPPLRERRGDLIPLIAHFLRGDGKGPKAQITGRALVALDEYPFPGNVRELEHGLRYALALAENNPVDVAHLPPEIAGLEPNEAQMEQRPLSEAMRDFEREYLKRTLVRAGGKRVYAAQLLGISRKNLWEKLRAYGLTSELDNADSDALVASEAALSSSAAVDRSSPAGE